MNYKTRTLIIQIVVICISIVLGLSDSLPLALLGCALFLGAMAGPSLFQK